MSDPEDPISIHYARDVGFAARLAAELCPEPEPSRAVLTLNYDGGREIGVYRTTLPRGDFGRALELLRRSRYEQQQTPPVSPETPFLVLGERASGQIEPTLRHFALPHLPLELSEAARELEQSIVARIRQHPLRVVSASARWQKPVMDPREPLGVHVRLENNGPLPIVIGNPLDPSLDWTGLNLVVRRAGGDGSEDGVKLTPVHLRPPPQAPTSGELTLAPGGSVAFDIEKKVYLPPGAYQGRLVYMNVIVREGDPQFIEGQLFIPLGPLTVAAPGPLG